MKRTLIVLLAGILIGFLLGRPDADTVEASVNHSKPLIPIARLPDGALYEGDMQDGLLHGQGKLEWPNGDRYQGEFFEGHFHGVGEWRYADGDIYRGNFKTGLFHGQGVYKTNDGETYVGEFVEDEFTGRGLYSSKTDGNYVGDFKDWDFFGEGTYRDVDGQTYQGKFTEAGIVHGQFIGSDGANYQGDFENWSYSGKGRLKTAEGDVYEGEFAHGYYEGQGTLTYATPLDGVEKVSGEWTWGELKNPQQGSPALSREELTETVLYNQHDLLQAAWGNFQPNNPEQIDLYFLGVGGYGSQAVFRREVNYVRDYFDQNLETLGKSMLLVNDRKNVEDNPLATVTSIERSLQVLSERMDTEQDILFVYLTSHGSSEFEFSLQQRGLSLHDLPAEKLAAMLKQLPVRWKVVVISACYSGGFIPELADENTLVLTASADDKRSFGCSDQNDFTYFGEAFFKDSLPVSDSFVGAFDNAVEIIQQREKSEGVTPSEPQIFKGGAIIKQLERWRQQRHARAQ